MKRTLQSVVFVTGMTLPASIHTVLGAVQVVEDSRDRRAAVDGNVEQTGSGRQYRGSGRHRNISLNRQLHLSRTASASGGASETLFDWLRSTASAVAVHGRTVNPTAMRA